MPTITSPGALVRLLAAETGQSETNYDGIMRAARGRSHSHDEARRQRERAEQAEDVVDHLHSSQVHVDAFLDAVRVECSRALGIPEATPVPFEMLPTAIRQALRENRSK